MLNIISEINQTQADLIKSFAIFYLLLLGNYIGTSIFTCYQETLIKTHKGLQLIFAFFLFYFLVTIVSNTGNLEYVPPIEKLIYSVFYFLLFFLDFFPLTFLVFLRRFLAPPPHSSLLSGNN